MLRSIFALLCTLSLTLACGQGEENDLSAQHAAGASSQAGGGGKADGARKIGIFLTSHGDIDEYEEIEPYIRSAFLKNVGVPLPKTLRELLQTVWWSVG